MYIVITSLQVGKKNHRCILYKVFSTEDHAKVITAFVHFQWHFQMILGCSLVMMFDTVKKYIKSVS